MENIMTEKELVQAGNELTVYAKSLSITSQSEYENAAMALTTIKNRIKAVKDYWADPKAKAAAAHKEICAKEKEMLAALMQSETIVKRAMQVFVDAEERKRREAEEAERRRREAEAEKLLEQAIQAEESGNAAAADINMAMAQIVEESPINVAPSVKAQGVSVRKIWKARVIDEEKVPVRFNGELLRPVDTALLHAMARETKAPSTIPGVEFYEETLIAAR